MSGFAETRVWLLRRALGLSGFPSPADVWRLAEYLGDCVRVRVEPEAVLGAQIGLPDGGSVVVLPARNEREEADCLLEELAHYLCRIGLEPPAPVGWERLGRGPRRNLGRWEERDEREAAEFCDAWRLPEEVLRRARTESDLLEAFDWPVERIRRRCEALRRRPPLRLGQPPPWSAWSAFSVRRRDRPSPRVEVVARQGGSLRFEIAAAPDVAFTGRLVQRDLGVLRPEEFVLKYRSCRVAPAAECGLPWEELF